LTDLTKNAAVEIMRRFENPRKFVSKQSMPCVTSKIDVEVSIYDEDDGDVISVMFEAEHDQDAEKENKKAGTAWETFECNSSAKKNQVKSYWGLESYEVEIAEQSDDDQSYQRTETVPKTCSPSLLPLSYADPSLSHHGACDLLNPRTTSQDRKNQTPLTGDVLRIEHTEIEIKDTSVYKVKRVGRNWWAATPSPLRYCQTIVRMESEKEGQ
jgi:hypothetical protein